MSSIKAISKVLEIAQSAEMDNFVEQEGKENVFKQ